MNRAQPLWGEGLFLRPQHFQQQDAYVDALNRRSLLLANPFAWGVKEFDLDKEGLGSGVLRLNRIDAVFSNGDSLLAPDIDQLPPPISLDKLAISGDGTEFFLAVRHLDSRGRNSTGDITMHQAARYLAISTETRDLFSDAAEADITTLSKLSQLKPSHEPHDQFQTLPLFRIRKTSSNGFETDPTFIPPSISLRSSPVIHQMLRRQIDVLLAKVDALYGVHREPSKNIVEFRSGDIASFWLLHTVSSACAALTHLLRTPENSPERLFHELSRLAGGLLTFSKSHTLNDLPTYSHMQPGPCFVHLDTLIRELLETVISTRYFSIALTHPKPAFYAGRLDSEKIDSKTVFFLSISAALMQAEIIESVPLRLKLGAPDDVEKLILSAMAGVRLSHAAQVPAAIPVRPGTCYFALDSHGPLYERMLKAQSVMIYVPEIYQDLKIEMIAITS